jgi:hypothetical protein
MKEHNKKTLIEALSTLPEHEPKDELWQAIEAQMDEPETDRFPHHLLKQLPDYEPPVQIWERIAGQLKPTGASVRLIGWRPALAVAASLAVLLIAYWYLHQPTALEADAISVVYSEENVDQLLLKQDWDEDEEVFQDYLQLCEDKKYICGQSEFIQLQEELAELTLAKNELKDALGDYNTNPDLVLQIKEIELERTDLLKKLMVMLI